MVTLLGVASAFLAIPLARQRWFGAFLLTRFQVERMLLDFPDKGFLKEMRSSCWTLRLKRRRALSSVSPS
jgi:hypothetical protein